MKARLIVVQYKQSYSGEYRPNVVDVSDEFALENNWIDYESKLQAYKADVPRQYEWVNIIDVDIPDDIIDSLAPKPTPVVTLGVVKEPEDGPQTIGGFRVGDRVWHRITNKYGTVAGPAYGGGGNITVDWDDAGPLATDYNNLRLRNGEKNG
jgi:hypothetical protein